MPDFDTKQLLQLVPPSIHDRLWIAGGYLADPERACDIDAWLLDAANNGEEFSLAHNYALKAWWNLEPLEIARRIAPYVGHDAPSEYVDSLKAKGIYYVGSLQLSTWPKPVQLFATPYTTITELLADFDVSTHQVAQHVATGMLATIQTTTATNAIPRITNWATPATTLVRIERLAKRYGFSLDALPDYARLRGLTENQEGLAA